MSEMRIVDISGDTKVIWDSGNEDEVEAAEATFDRLIKKGYKAYSVKSRGKKGEVIAKFDPCAEKIILAPQMAGG